MKKKPTNIFHVIKFLDKVSDELKDLRAIISDCIDYYETTNKLRLICLDDLKHVIPLHIMKIVILKASVIFGSDITFDEKLKHDMYKIGLVAVNVNTCFNRNLL